MIARRSRRCAGGAELQRDALAYSSEAPVTKATRPVKWFERCGLPAVMIKCIAAMDLCGSSGQWLHCVAAEISVCALAFAAIGVAFADDCSDSLHSANIQHAWLA